MTDDNGIFLWKERAIASFYRSCDPLFRPRLRIVSAVFLALFECSTLNLYGIRGNVRASLFSHGKRSYLRTVRKKKRARVVCFSQSSLVISRDVFQFGRRYCLRYFIWIPPSSPFLVSLSLLLRLLLGDVDSREGNVRGLRKNCGSWVYARHEGV